MKDIEKIVDDICELAPELRKDRDGVRKIVASLMEGKPEVVVNETFVQELRQKLQGSIRAQKAAEGARATSNGLWQGVTTFFSSKAVVGFAVLVMLVLVALPFVDLSKGAYFTNLSMSPQIQDAEGKLAFGSLLERSDTEAMAEIAMEEFAALDEAEDLLSADVTPSTMLSMQEEGMGGGVMMDRNTEAALSSIAPDMKGGMMYWDYQYPIYSYDGTMPSIDDEGYVYRRQTDLQTNSFDGFLQGFGLGLIDLGSFKNIGLQRLELTTDGKPSYNISIDMQQGEISIYRMWTGEYDGVRQEGVEYSKINNAKVIKIANDFLKKHNIDISAYGTPEIEEQNYSIMPMMENDVEVAIEEMSPEYGRVYSINVRYPLAVDGLRVVEQGGYSAGINVSINVSGGYVEGVWGLMSQNYERSLYPQVTDTDKILDMLAYGGYSRGPVVDPEYTKTTNVSTGDPEAVLMKYWKYDNSMGRSTELLVPALMFNVDQKTWREQGVYVQDAIVIPIVQDIIEDTWDRPIPMPYMMEGSTGSSQGGTPIEVEAVESMPPLMLEDSGDLE